MVADSREAADERFPAHVVKTPIAGVDDRKFRVHRYWRGSLDLIIRMYPYQLWLKQYLNISSPTFSSLLYDLFRWKMVNLAAEVGLFSRVAKLRKNMLLANSHDIFRQ